MQLFVCLSIKVTDNKQSNKPWLEVQIPLWYNSAKTYIPTKYIWSNSDFIEKLDDNQENMVTLR